MSKTTDEAAKNNRETWNSFRRQRDAGLCKIRHNPALGIQAGTPHLKQIFFDLAGELSGKRLLDLGCGEGAELLDWAYKGAQVVGVDNSPVQLKAAQRFADQLGITCQLVLADILRLPEDLLRGEFDIVFSSWVTAWIGDPEKWFQNVYLALKPGGIFIFNGGHPFTNYVRAKANGDLARETYFSEGPFIETSDDPHSWNPSGENLTTIEWNHTLGTLLTGVAQAGFRISHFLEQTEIGDGPKTDMPDEFTLRATKE